MIGMYRGLVKVMVLRSYSMHGARAQSEPWLDEHQWIEAWSRAEFNRVQPSRDPASSSDGGVGRVPAVGRHSTAATAALAAQRPAIAAELVADMEPGAASKVIAGLPPGAAEEMLTAVLAAQRREIKRLATKLRR